MGLLNVHQRREDGKELNSMQTIGKQMAGKVGESTVGR
jgi:hypothetical protein